MDVDSFRAPDVQMLIVDDNEINAKVALRFAKAYGINGDLAFDGKQAVSMVQSKNYDLVLMDVMMPKMNGYEATKAIRSLHDRPDADEIPIIAMTANAFAEDVQASLDAGMNGHLSKPIVIEEVVKTIARNLN